jgi:hypothetical protein
MESQAGRPDPAAARQALAEVREARAGMKLRLLSPRWYWLACPTLIGFGVALQAAPAPWNDGVVYLTIGFVLFALAYQRRTGRRLGLGAGAAPLMRWFVPGYLGIMTLAAAGVWIDRTRPDVPWATVLIGLLIMPFGWTLLWMADAGRRTRIRAEM